MGAVYAQVSDILLLRPLTAPQQEAAESLLTKASAMLRQEARNHKKDIDAMIADPVSGEDFALAVNSVVVSAVCRALDSADTGAYEQASESLGPYTYNYRYINAGQQLYFLRNELKELGLSTTQKIGWLDVYGVSENGNQG